MPTLTQALAEIVLLKKKIDHKSNTICSYLTRFSNITDPITTDGGSKVFVAQERQSLADLLKRLAKIRNVVHGVNQVTPLTVNNQTKTISEWIIWKREVFQFEEALFKNMITVLEAARKKQPQVQYSPTTALDNPQVIQVLYNIDESELRKEKESLTDTHDRLDGELSLLNATTMVEY